MDYEDDDAEELFADPEDVLTFAQAYYATEFPNSSRRGCPPPELLRAAARSGEVPGSRWREHLFECSECFRSYRSARLNCRSPSQPRAVWNALSAALSPALVRPAAVGLAALCIVVFGMFAAALLLRAVREASYMASNYPAQASPTQRAPLPAGPGVAEPSYGERPSAPAPGNASVMQQGAPERRRKAKARREWPQRMTLPVVQISLEEDTLLRGDGQSKEVQHAIKLAQKRQRLRLRLPRGSGGGRYTIKIVDAFGRPIVTKAAVSAGKILSVDLDLRGLETNSYRLCVGREDEAPDCYRLEVIEQPRR